MSVNASGAKTTTLSDLRRYQTRAGEKKKKEKIEIHPTTESLTGSARLHTALGVTGTVLLQYRQGTKSTRPPKPMPCVAFSTLTQLRYGDTSFTAHSFHLRANLLHSRGTHATWIHYSPRFHVTFTTIRHLQQQQRIG